MKRRRLNFKDGSSLKILENGAYIVLETKTARPVSMAEKAKPVKYNEPPPPRPTGALEQEPEDHEQVQF